MTLDDDLSSPEEEAPPIITAPVTVPLKAEVKKQPKPLVSANDIVLTESDEESDEPTVIEDEDIDMDELTKQSTSVTKNFGKDVSIDKLFEIPQKKTAKSKKKALDNHTIEETEPSESILKPAKKSGGLLLEFMSSLPPAKPPVTESPVTSERRDSKRTKKSKKRRESKEAEAVVSENTKKEASSDPFAAVSSLDAWLNSDSTVKVSRHEPQVSVLYVCIIIKTEKSIYA